MQKKMDKSHFLLILDLVRIFQVAKNGRSRLKLNMMILNLEEPYLMESQMLSEMI
jgi:hypothetical protein